MEIMHLIKVLILFIYDRIIIKYLVHSSDIKIHRVWKKLLKLLLINKIKKIYNLKMKIKKKNEFWRYC